ncbi:MAG: glycine-rich protein, partial [Solirubrobacteraceae bacterium]
MRRLSVRMLTCAAVYLLGVLPASAALPANCTQSATAATVSCTYVSILNEQTFTVPAGVTSVQVTAVGARGGDVGAVLGGPGAIATAALPVTPGQTLYVEVGHIPIGGGGGWNGGGGSNGGSGEGGGGASDVQTVSRGQSCPGLSQTTWASRLIVAGGGGG